MEKPSTARIALKWGIISAIISVIFTIVIYTFDLWSMTLLSVLVGLLSTGIIVALACKEFKSLNSGFMTFGEGLGLGMLIVTVSSLISISFNQLYINVIDPGIQEEIMNFQEEMYLKQGISQEQVDTMLQQAERFNSPGMQFLFGMLFALLLGFLVSIVVAAVMKKNRPVFE